VCVLFWRERGDFEQYFLIKINMLQLLAELLLLFEELKFWKKKKKRRQLEKEKKLQKRIMIHPSIKVLLIGLLVILIIKILLGFFYSDRKTSITVNKIYEVRKNLEKEKKDLGKYPFNLKDIIRNNPLKKNIIFDAWGNEFYYKLYDKGLKYRLISKGKDGQLNTTDDIVVKQ